jgi:hypothetical protein
MVVAALRVRVTVGLRKDPERPDLRENETEVYAQGCGRSVQITGLAQYWRNLPQTAAKPHVTVVA